MAYINNWREKGIYRVFTGKVSGDEVVQAVLEIEGDQRFEDLNYIINDFRLIEEYSISERDITTIVTIDKHAVKLNPKIRVAIVATLVSLQEQANLYCHKMHSNPYDCKVFDNMQDAEDWAILSDSKT